MEKKVQVEHIAAESGTELQDSINSFCEACARSGEEVIDISFVIDRAYLLPYRAMVVYKTDMSGL